MADDPDGDGTSFNLEETCEYDGDEGKDELFWFGGETIRESDYDVCPWGFSDPDEWMGNWDDSSASWTVKTERSIDASDSGMKYIGDLCQFRLMGLVMITDTGKLMEDMMAMMEDPDSIDAESFNPMDYIYMEPAPLMEQMMAAECNPSEDPNCDEDYEPPASMYEPYTKWICICDAADCTLAENIPAPPADGGIRMPGTVDDDGSAGGDSGAFAGLAAAGAALLAALAF